MNKIHDQLRKAIREEVAQGITQGITQGISVYIEAHLAKEVEKGVINALKSFGADADNKRDLQQDFHFIRRLRKRSEESSRNLIKTLISVTIGAAALALWEGIRRLVQK